MFESQEGENQPDLMGPDSIEPDSIEPDSLDMEDIGGRMSNGTANRPVAHVNKRKRTTVDDAESQDSLNSNLTQSWREAWVVNN